MFKQHAGRHCSDTHAQVAGEGRAMPSLEPLATMPAPEITDPHFLVETQEKNGIGADGHLSSGAHALPVIGQPKRLRHFISETQERIVQASDDRAHLVVVPELKHSSVIAEIVQGWRLRQTWLQAEVALILRAKAVLRQWTDGDKDAANALFEAVTAGEQADPNITLVLSPILAAIRPLKDERTRHEKSLHLTVKSLPIFAWVRAVKGFGPGNFAAVIGEAGDLGAYRNPSCLWKRLGLAVIEGARQGKRTDPDEALLHGYSPRRRSVAWTLGDTLSKAQLLAAKKSGTEYGRPKGPYGEVYVRRRERTAITHPDWNKAHSMNDARRIMTKAVLRDLWAKWLVT